MNQLYQRMGERRRNSRVEGRDRGGEVTVDRGKKRGQWREQGKHPIVAAGKEGAVPTGGQTLQWGFLRAKHCSNY